VIDNGSGAIGTYEILRHLAARVPGLRIDRDDGPFDQARMATDMANALLREGPSTDRAVRFRRCWDLSIPRLAPASMAEQRVNAVHGDRSSITWQSGSFCTAATAGELESWRIVGWNGRWSGDLRRFHEGGAAFLRGSSSSRPDARAPPAGTMSGFARGGQSDRL